jgi:hypothetical protein
MMDTRWGGHCIVESTGIGNMDLYAGICAWPSIRIRPNALARFAAREESAALLPENAAKRSAHWFAAFKYYAAAAERARREDWPDSAWRNWRYRRATLARMLARDGMMQQVAEAYAAARAAH